MSKAIAIPIICVLAVAFLVAGYFLWSQTGKLGDARDDIADLEDYSATLEGDIDDLEGEVSGLEGNVAGLEDEVSGLEDEVADLEENVTDLEDDLADSESTVSYLEISLADANSEISDLEDDVIGLELSNALLTGELDTVKSPRHFSSLSELTSWINNDDTNIMYASERPIVQAFILMVRALRDGYILTTSIWESGGTVWVINNAYIGSNIYKVDAGEDDVWLWKSGMETVPSRPLY
jgi:septal ring factor EnvC (AmiA/AmiB activator)